MTVRMQQLASYSWRWNIQSSIIQACNICSLLHGTWCAGLGFWSSLLTSTDMLPPSFGLMRGLLNSQVFWFQLLWNYLENCSSFRPIRCGDYFVCYETWELLKLCITHSMASRLSEKYAWVSDFLPRNIAACMDAGTPSQRHMLRDSVYVQRGHEWFRFRAEDWAQQQVCSLRDFQNEEDGWSVLIRQYRREHHTHQWSWSGWWDW